MTDAIVEMESRSPATALIEAAAAYLQEYLQHDGYDGDHKMISEATWTIEDSEAHRDLMLAVREKLDQIPHGLGD